MFKLSEKKIGHKIIRDTLADHLLAQKSDTLYLELNMTAIGNIDFELIRSSNDLSYQFMSSLKEIQKLKLFIIPSFSFSWGSKQETFSFNTKTHLGILPNYLINSNEFNSLRTRDPMFSVIISDLQGKGDNRWEKVINNSDSFGKNSIYSELHKSNALLMNIGTNYFDPTFIHYVEQYFHENISKLSYRDIKTFRGFYEGSEKLFSHRSFVRKDGISYNYNFDKVQADLHSANILKYSKLGNANMISANACEYFDFIFARLKLDKDYLIRAT